MLRRVVIVVILSIAWVLITGRVALDSLLLGFVVSVGVVALIDLIERQAGSATGIARLPFLFLYFGTLARQIIASDIMVIRRVLSPQSVEESTGMFNLPVGCDRETIAALSAHAITSAPGSMVIDYAEGHTVMVVHTLDVQAIPTLQKEQVDRHLLCERMLANE